MKIRTARNLLLSGLLLACSVLASAHPGHEFHVEGIVTKVRAQQFDGSSITVSVTPPPVTKPNG